jgi:hypothetical protein
LQNGIANRTSLLKSLPHEGPPSLGLRTYNAEQVQMGPTALT